jgi:NAD(P)-dependent dehydrogenase (short-subunit alcohol dehydrogenase family)
MQSKLAQVMFTIDLARQLEGTGITVNCLHPATYMDTTMVREAGTTPISTVDEGADAIINLAGSPVLVGRTGLYYVGLHPQEADPQAYEDEARDKLRTLSLQLTGLSAASAAE